MGYLYIKRYFNKMEQNIKEDKMNGNDLLEHIENCEVCWQKNNRMETCESRTADKLEHEIELCCIETELGEDYII